jgi:hypothetical protein
MERSNFVYFVLALLLLCSSCEKVIDVNLNDSDPQIVIEGEITTNKGPYLVTVSESKNFTEDNDFPGRNDAVVAIKDLGTGASEQLKGTGSGNYQTILLQGLAGHSYQLSVLLDGKTYTSTSAIPLKAVRLDKLYASASSLDDQDVYMVPVFRDPAGKGNYYRLRQWLNGTIIKGSYVRSDEAVDGRTFDGQLYYSTAAGDGNPLIKNGDIMTVELQCVDKGVYDYFRTLGTTIAQDASTPSNPLTNISGGAIGVFNACRSNKLSVTAKF